MTSIAQINENEQREIRGSLKKFFAEYHLSGLLKMCRAEKQKGFSAFEIFRYLLCLVFCDRSMYSFSMNCPLICIQRTKFLAAKRTSIDHIEFRQHPDQWRHIHALHNFSSRESCAREYRSLLP